MDAKQLDFILNDALNKALISKDRIKQPNSNNVADFVNRYIADNNKNLQLKQTDFIRSCNLHAKEIIKKLTMRPHLEDKEGLYDMVNDEIQMIKIVEEYLLKNYKH